MSEQRTAPVVGYDRVTNVPLCQHGDDAEACQLAHYRVALCGQLAYHGPHVVEHGPDQPRNCPGRGHTLGCVAGVACEPYCEADA